jgi:hypothetical protein
MLSNIIYPALSVKRHAVPLLFDIVLLPCRGQLAFIAIIILLNIFFSVAGYNVPSPNISHSNLHDFIEHFANRVGLLSFANLPSIVLYSSRNNPLIGLTGWPYSTFLLYHRWLAYIGVLQALNHWGIWFIMHIHALPHKFSQAYWNAGMLIAFSFFLIIPLSALFVRQRYYELFPNLHVALAIITVGGCYYHIYWKFEHAWGYENWVYLAILVWGIEEGVRAIKMMRNGVNTAIITPIDTSISEWTSQVSRQQGMRTFTFQP